MKILFLLLGLFFLALPDNAKAIDGKDTNCVWYGECYDKENKVPCKDNNPPREVTDQETLKLLKTTCPELLQGDQTTVCCNKDQLKTLETNLEIPKVLGLGRCPPCMWNFRSMFCNMTCSPHHSLFLKVTEFTENLVKQLNFYIKREYADGLFSSCKDVQGISPGQTALETICMAEKCTSEGLLVALGKSLENGGFSPMQINFKVTDDFHIKEHGQNFIPFGDNAKQCSEAIFSSGFACSCRDCPDSCPAETPFDVLESSGPLMLYIDGAYFVMAIICIIVVQVIITVYAYYSGLHTSECKNTSHDTSPKPNKKRCLWLPNILYNWCFSSLFLHKLGLKIEKTLCFYFSQWGTFVACHPIPVMVLSIVLSLILGLGLVLKFTVTTDPVDLWVSGTSQARQDMEYFNKHFGPFYRVQQIIVTPTNKEFFNATVDQEQHTWGPVFREDFLLEVLDLQKSIEGLVAFQNGSNVTLSDICVAPLSPLNNACVVQSVFSFNYTYFTNTTGLLPQNYLSHLLKCMRNPIQYACFAPYNGPLIPAAVAFGGFHNNSFQSSTALVLTFPVNNYYDNSENQAALAWEKVFIDFVKNYSRPNLTISFKAERSVEDELERGSQSDITTIAISYIIMFVYIALALGEVKSWRTLLIDSKITLGLAGVVIVLLSVVASIGLFCFAGVPATLIIMEVIPFLVLAVGVDNIFILVQAYQRDERNPEERLEEQIGRVVGERAPSMLLSSLSMSSCFFIGALTDMPAVKIFALYAGLALLINFLLQMTCFLALFVLDTKRQEGNRLDLCWCWKLSKVKNRSANSLLHRCFKSFYAPILMKPFVRVVVLLIFTVWTCSSLAVINKIDIGFDQELSMPQDSYLLSYFKSINKYLSVGPPLYFVITDGYNYSDLEMQNRVCSHPECDSDSFYFILKGAVGKKEKTYLAEEVVSWLDDFIDFMKSTSCCYEHSNSTHCPSIFKDELRCESCASPDSRVIGKEFDHYVPFFLSDLPGEKCSKAGKSQFGSAVELNPTSDNKLKIGATHFMTYHTILRTSKDFYKGLEMARYVSDKLTEKIREKSSNQDVRVFPYSIVHVFYEQYLTIWTDTLKSLSLSLFAIFVVTFLILGLNFFSAAITVFTILMITVNMMGLMYWWNISLNAVSLVNLVVGIGISVEFCSHITRLFALSSQVTKVERARTVLEEIGSSVSTKHEKDHSTGDR
ncbi:NPC intracellular cholesterol transporter 1-like isoform X2 [Tachypleus tridentatus]|uniref:NPC intracellular cholesterol transporter 1-like isoform X2 n=1 Tax=Tachypleus tridentatus TaxID=6853 RepID=UPI003FD5D6E9